MFILKPDDGIWIETASDICVRIEGRQRGHSPIRANVQYGEAVIISVVSVRLLDLPELQELHRLMDAVIDAIKMAQTEMERVHGKIVA